MMFREEMEVDVERKLLKMGGSKREKVEVSWGKKQQISCVKSYNE